jgi:glycosyltransferase involved in cell wall biosynthesis
MAPRSVTVILSSYNQPNALRLALASLGAQTDLDFDLVVADDGSAAPVLKLIEEFGTDAPFPVRFVTQAHRGFGKVRVLNDAVRVSNGEQLIFCDGDCVAFRDLVAVHRTHYRPNGYCVGARIGFDLERSRTLTPAGVAAGQHEELVSLLEMLAARWVHVKNLAYLRVGRRHRPKIGGGNWSVSRAVLLAVDAFDEAYEGMSGEDSDVRNRLNNFGADRVSLWHRAFVCHLDHEIDPGGHISTSSRCVKDPDLYAGSDARVQALRGLSSRAARQASAYGESPA